MDSTYLRKNYPNFSDWYRFTKENVKNLTKEQGVYIFRTKDGRQFGRLAGQSDILYIGSTIAQKGLKQRLNQYLNPGSTQWTNKRVNSFIQKYQIEFSTYVCKNSPDVELTLLRKYIDDHDELPPLNRSSGRLWKPVFQDSIVVSDELEIKVIRGKDSKYRALS